MPPATEVEKSRGSEHGGQKGLGEGPVTSLVPLCLVALGLSIKGIGRLLVGATNVGSSLRLIGIGGIRHARILAWVRVVLGEEGRVGADPVPLEGQHRLANLGREWTKAKGRRVGRGNTRKERRHTDKSQVSQC